MNSVLQRVYEIGIIPVIAFNSVDEALPLCKALMAGGLPAAEVTFSPPAPRIASRRSMRSCPICCWAPALS